jgi:phosphopantothenoylcysteine synthetase/decarboxylase
MNTFMYEHFLTDKQIKIMKEEFHFVHIPSVVKKLKCGDIGIGGIADTRDIFSTVDKYLELIYSTQENNL